MPNAKRVSSLLVTADLDGTGALYRDFGFTRVETGDPGCVGYVAGETGIILVDRDFAVRCWGEVATTTLAGQFVPYVFVGRLDDVRADRVIADVQTWFGTHERVIETIAGPVVVVEMAA